MIIFFKLTFYVSVRSDLCPKLIHNDKQNDASGFDFRSADTEGATENPACLFAGAEGKRVGFGTF
jgi:hypothetical protein